VAIAYRAQSLEEPVARSHQPHVPGDRFNEDRGNRSGVQIDDALN
jgi:hypothetical protein